MKEAKLYFGLLLPYETTAYTQLKALSVFKEYSPDPKQWRWVFRMSDRDKVFTLLSYGIEFLEHEVTSAVEFCPALKKNVFSTPWKGQGKYTVKEFPQIFQVIEHRKVQNPENPDDFKIVDSKTTVNKFLINHIWKQVIEKMPMNKKVKSKTVAKNICQSLGLEHFFEGEKFLWKKFFGSRSKTKTDKGYFVYFYYPMKVLQEHYSCIEYYKNGQIERLKEDISVQLPLEVNNENSE